MFFRHLEIVLGRNQGTVADPLADDVQRIRLGQFGLTRSTEILETPGPGVDPGMENDMSRCQTSEVTAASFFRAMALP